MAATQELTSSLALGPTWASLVSGIVRMQVLRGSLEGFTESGVLVAPMVPGPRCERAQGQGPALACPSRPACLSGAPDPENFLPTTVPSAPALPQGIPRARPERATSGGL